MKHLILLIALISFSVNAQKNMVLIEGFDKQEISVTDRFEENYKYRRKYFKDIKMAMAAFEIHKPLRTKN